VNAVFQDQDVDKSPMTVNPLSNHSMNVLPVGYPKRLSSQLESAPAKSIARPNIAPIGKPPGYRRKSTSTGIVGGATIGAERRIQQPLFEPMGGSELPLSEVLQSESTQEAANEPPQPSPSFFSLFGDSKGKETSCIRKIGGFQVSRVTHILILRPWYHIISA
jgi:hypothetical protein